MTSQRRSEHSLQGDTAFLLARANAHSLAAANAALEPLGLRVRSYSVLALAVDEERLSQRDIAEYLRLDPSQVVALVDDLQERHLVTREPDPTDRRAKVVVATEAGRQLHKEAAEATRRALDDMLGGLQAEERAVLRALLGRLAFPS